MKPTNLKNIVLLAAAAAALSACGTGTVIKDAASSKIIKDMSDADVMQRIRDIAADYDVTLNDEQAGQIFRLCRQFEGLSAEEIQKRLVNMTKAAQKWQNFGDVLSNAFESVADFFRQVGEFFAEIFDKWFGGSN